MQIFLEDYKAHFYTNRLQVQAYYKATEGRAKKVLLPLMDENHPQHVATAKEVLKAEKCCFRLASPDPLVVQLLRCMCW
jgi:hypothetical protein